MKIYLHKSNSKTINKIKLSGFTVVELAAVIAVSAILVAITVVAYGNWQRTVTETQVKSDLNGVSTAMETYRTFNNKYPNAIPSTFKASRNVILSGGGLGGGIEYCVDATSSDDSTIQYYIDQDNDKFPQSGTCATRPKRWIQIASGANHTCGITTLGKGYCWGSNISGGLGNNSTNNSLVPIAVDDSGTLSGKTLKNITAGANHTCAIASDDNAYCWGKNDYGQLGDGSFVNKLVPTPVSMSGVLTGKKLLYLNASGGAEHTCAIASDLQAYCWGSNDNGQLGNNSTTNSNTPVAVYNTGALVNKTIKSISAAGIYGHTCAIASDLQAYCWGSNNYGLLGDGTDTNSNVPIQVLNSGVLAGKTIVDISTGDNNTCLIASDNYGYCWGENSNGAVGDHTVINRLSPVAIDRSGALSGRTLQKISVGGGNNGHPCAIASDNNVYCWGFNGYGALGNGNTYNSAVPVAVNKTGVLNERAVISLSVGADHVCALATDKQSYCWGWGNDGQLGAGNDYLSTQTNPVLTLSNV